VVFEEVSVSYRHRLPLESVIDRALLLSTTSPAVLGERRQAFEVALPVAAEPFAKDGTLSEEVWPEWLFAGMDLARRDSP
jgi:hypothetical protein